jgi:hypothetical protein
MFYEWVYNKINMNIDLKKLNDGTLVYVATHDKNFMTEEKGEHFVIHASKERFLLAPKQEFWFESVDEVKKHIDISNLKDFFNEAFSQMDDFSNVIPVLKTSFNSLKNNDKNISKYLDEKVLELKFKITAANNIFSGYIEELNKIEDYNNNQIYYIESEILFISENLNVNSSFLKFKNSIDESKEDFLLLKKSMYQRKELLLIHTNSYIEINMIKYLENVLIDLLNIIGFEDKLDTLIISQYKKIIKEKDDDLMLEDKEILVNLDQKEDSFWSKIDILNSEDFTQEVLHKTNLIMEEYKKDSVHKYNKLNTQLKSKYSEFLSSVDEITLSIKKDIYFIDSSNLVEIRKKIKNSYSTAINKYIEEYINLVSLLKN